MNALPTGHYRCAISTCTWTHTPPNTENLAAFVPNDLEAANAAFMAQAEAIEQACRDHFESHTVEDWVAEIARLREGRLICGACISDARNAEARKQPPPPIHFATTIASGMAICDVEGRHRIMPQVGGGLITPGASGIPGMN